MIYYDWHKNRINGLNKRLAAYTLVVQDILNDINKEACRIAGRTGYSVDSEKPFSFKDYPQTKAAVDRLKQQYVSDLKTYITTNTSKEWRNSNVVQDLLINKVFTEGKMQIDGRKRKHLYQTNPEALKAFQNRRINQQGNLSTTLWNQSNDYLDELEQTIGTAIKKGTSAVTLSKQVSKYLADFDKLKADYKEQYGKAIDVQDCEWRAARLARSEINMAYRTAEQQRWQQMDFVLGYEIQLSKTHTDVDICDELCGQYPKDFVWTGWHPNDKCYAVPILMNQDDFVKWNNGEPVDAKPIKEVPDAFKAWVKENADKIQSSKTIPYFLKDNKDVVHNLLAEKSEKRAVAFDRKLSALQKAQVRHNSRTEEEINDIRKDWNERKLRNIQKDIEYGNLPEGMSLNVKHLFAKNRNGDVDYVKDKISNYEKIAKRHASRTEQQIEAIKISAWDRQLKRSVIFDLTEQERKALANNWLVLEKELGIKKGRLMSIDEADKQSANPLYYDSTDYRTNCAVCAQTYMLRLWGFDVTAKSRVANEQTKWLVHGHAFDLWEQKNGARAIPYLQNRYKLTHNNADMSSPNVMKSFYEDATKKQGVYIVRLLWKDGTGHVAILQRTADGKLYFIDPQSFKSNTVLHNIEEISNNSLFAPAKGVLRVDNLVFNKDYCSIFEVKVQD